MLTTPQQAAHEGAGFGAALTAPAPGPATPVCLVDNGRAGASFAVFEVLGCRRRGPPPRSRIAQCLCACTGVGTLGSR